MHILSSLLRNFIFIDTRRNFCVFHLKPCWNFSDLLFLVFGNPLWLAAKFLHKLQQVWRGAFHYCLHWTKHLISPFHLESVKGWKFGITARRWHAKVLLAGSCAARMTNSVQEHDLEVARPSQNSPLVLHFQALWQALAEPLQRTSLLTKPLAHLSRGILECQNLI